MYSLHSIELSVAVTFKRWLTRAVKPGATEAIGPLKFWSASLAPICAHWLWDKPICFLIRHPVEVRIFIQIILFPIRHCKSSFVWNSEYHLWENRQLLIQTVKWPLKVYSNCTIELWLPVSHSHCLSDNGGHDWLQSMGKMADFWGPQMVSKVTSEPPIVKNVLDSMPPNPLHDYTLIDILLPNVKHFHCY